MTRLLPALILVAALGLAACDSQNDSADQRTAVGQILPGSASDAMIPYDTLRSQPPLAPQTGAAGAGKASGQTSGAVDDAAEPASSDGEAGAAPAEAAPAATTEPSAE